MNNQIITYYIPNNPNILQGRIYTLYINNNTNLDLTSILDNKTITLGPTESTNGQLTQQNLITISKEDYTRLLELNNLSYQLSTKRTKDIENFIKQETDLTSELTKINTEREILIKKLTKGKEYHQ